MYIDTVSFNKSMVYAPGHGYSIRPTTMSKYRSIIAHTTNSPRVGTSLYQEARFIFNSPDISADYLIGKEGQIIQFLDPRKYIAWHTGATRARIYSNPYAIGIEMHHTPKEGHITTKQFEALDWLVRKLIKDHAIDPRYVDTHRYVAVPAGRKIDPSGFPDNEFYVWRETLFAPPVTNISYRVNNVNGVYVRQSPQVNDHNIAGTLNYNDIFVGGDIKNDENNQYIQGTNKWVHLLHGISNGKVVDGLGFVHTSNLKTVP